MLSTSWQPFVEEPHMGMVVSCPHDFDHIVYKPKIQTHQMPPSNVHVAQRPSTQLTVDPGSNVQHNFKAPHHHVISLKWTDMDEGSGEEFSTISLIPNKQFCHK